MGLNFNGTEIDKVIFNDIELDKVIFNGVVVYESGDTFIINVSTVQNSYYGEEWNDLPQYLCRINITPIDDKCKVTFNGETKVVPYVIENDAVKKQTIEFEVNSAITQHMTIKGSFTQVSVSEYNAGESGAYVDGLRVNYVQEWYKLYNVLVGILNKQSLTQDIHLPNNITLIPRNTLEISNKEDINLYLPDNNTFLIYGMDYTNGRFFKNSIQVNDSGVADSTTDGHWFLLNGYLLATYKSMYNTTNLIIPNGTEVIAEGFFGSAAGETGCASTTITFNNDGKLKRIGSHFADSNTNITSVTIPSSVVEIGDSVFDSATNLTSVRFEQSSDKVITFGQSVFYSKSAKEMTIYTDNLYVVNYDWDSDNITPTFYKLNGTLWDKVTTPTLSITGNVLSISNTNATSFEITKSDILSPVTKTVTTNNVNLVELFDITDFTTQLTISVIGIKEGIVKSDKASITYTPVEE